jgi:hypothetical protein
MLFSIEIITALFHLIYAGIFARIRWYDPKKYISERVMTAGGVPCRWYEYALTASLMSFFISNGAAVYDIYALLGIGLATFGLTFFGLLIELTLYQGRSRLALMLLYIPGFALFAAGWVGSIRQLFTDVAALSCQDGNNIFFCTKTCFGERVPIPVFVFVLFLMFFLFPLILINKIYVVGGWQAQWTAPFFRMLDFLCLTRRFPFMRIVQYPFGLLVNLLCFVAFTFWGMLLAIATLLTECMWPLKPSLSKESIRYPDDNLKWSAFWSGELHFALASATSKLFLFIYFMMVFARRNW